ncbi:DUF4139 domain-containing protein [uncultured Jannaschia sp.]|uniref:DUF4139 domain-containing protein n=1 Tax=uncultured Jannaschia sp. TaxID=293347 RepID=UPI00260D555F|nr:DUF4139 domain-containing protein [uncultured Jannaschia sp.]
MRLALLLLCLPGSALADDILLAAPATEAVIFANGASVTRVAEADLPAGAHRLLMPVLPVLPGADGPPRIELSGATLGPQGTAVAGWIDGRDFFTPRQRAAYDGWIAARDAAERASDERVGAAAGVEAAETRLDFLRSISGANVTRLEAWSVTETAQTIGEAVAGAQRDLAAARDAERNARRDLEDADRAEDQARRDFEATGANLGPVSLLSVAVTLDVPGTVEATLTQFAPQAGWTPRYDATLDEGMGRVTLARKVELFSNVGLPLADVTLRLSTADPFAQTAPQEVLPDLVVTGDFPVPEPRGMAPEGAALDAMRLAEPAAEPLRAAADTDGPIVAYDYPGPVDIPVEGQRVTLLLDTIDFDARMFNRAAPRTDRTAFLMAGFDNNTEEPLLAGPVALYRGAEKVGEAYLPPVPAGDGAELAFGPQEHLPLEFVRAGNEVGDRGVFQTSGYRQQDLLFRIRNLSGESETVEARYALPHDEAEDIEIVVDARPEPAATGVEDRRGVAEWTLDVPARGEVEVEIDVSIEWPEGKTLIWRP